MNRLHETLALTSVRVAKGEQHILKAAVRLSLLLSLLLALQACETPNPVPLLLRQVVILVPVAQQAICELALLLVEGAKVGLECFNLLCVSHVDLSFVVVSTT